MLLSPLLLLFVIEALGSSLWDGVLYESLATVATLSSSPLTLDKSCYVNEKTPVSIGACGTGDCLQPGSNLVTSNVSQTFYGTVTNLATCDSSFVISLLLNYGLNSATLSFGNYTYNLLDPNNFIAGVQPLSLCCRDLRRLSGSTVGNFSIFLEAFGPFSAEILIPVNVSRLPLSLYSNLVPTQVTCAGTVLDITSGTPVNVPATSDPYYSYWSSLLKNNIGNNVDLLTLPTDSASQLTTIIWVTNYQPNTQVGTIGFGVGEKYMNATLFQNECYITYESLNDGVSTKNYNVIVEYPTADCTYTTYTDFKRSFDNVLATLEGSELPTPSIAEAVVYLAETHTLSLTWQACLDVAVDFLPVTVATVVQQTTDCYQSPGTVAWSNDPCCNTDLQTYLCCETKSINVDYNDYGYDQDVILNSTTCQSPLCLLQPLKNLQLSLQNDYVQTCNNNAAVATTDPRFISSPFVQCRGFVFTRSCGTDVDCFDQGQGSLCITAEAICTAPCKTDADCYNGICGYDIYYGNYCTNLTLTNTTFQNQAFYDCVKGSVDPYLAVLLEQQVDAAATVQGTTAEKFIQLISQNECLTPGGLPWPMPGMDENDCNTNEGWCQWLNFPIGVKGEFGSPIQLQNCLDAVNLDPFPAYIYREWIWIPRGWDQLCEVRTYDTQIVGVDYDESTCISLGGDKWIGPNILGRTGYQGCLRHETTEAGCYDLDGCIGPAYLNVTCSSYCVTSTPAASCTGTTSKGNVQGYYSWIGNASGTPQATCVVTTSFAGCTAEGGTWFSGRHFVPAQSVPPFFCSDGANTQPLEGCQQRTCSSCVNTYDQPQCTNQTLCEETYECPSPFGCEATPQIANEIGINCAWNPNYCVMNINPRACNGQLLTFVDANIYQNETSCDQTKICNNNGNPNATRLNPINIPAGYSLRNESECSKCGGKIEDFYSWKKSTWGVVKTKLYANTMSPKVIMRSHWGPRVEQSLFEALLDRARAARLATILKSQLYCLYGAQAALLSLVSCSCDLNQTYCPDLASLSGNPVAVVSACESVPIEVQVESVLINITDTFNTEGANPCIDFSVVLVPQAQFEYRTTHVTSSFAIQSETQLSKSSSIFVYNSEGVVVGQIVDNGLRFDITSSSNFSGITVCFNMPNASSVSWQLQGDLKYWDIATAGPDYEFHPTGNAIPIDQTTIICLPLTQNNYTYFPIGLVDLWDSRTIYNTWLQEEKGLMIFCIITYLIISIVAILNIAGHLARTKSQTPTNTIWCLFCIVVLASLGGSYLICVLVGTIQDNHLDPLLNDLPGLMLLTCVTLIIITWKSIIDNGRSLGDAHALKRIQYFAYLFLLPLYLVFIGLLVAAAATASNPVYTCAVPPSEQPKFTLADALTLSYKAVFAFFAFILALVFVYYSILIYLELHKFQDTFGQVIQKNGIATLSATLSLFILVAVTLYTTQHQLKNTTKLAFIISVLIVPSYAITYLFSIKSTFAQEILSSFTSKSSRRHSVRSKTSKTSKTSGKHSTGDSTK